MAAGKKKPEEKNTGTPECERSLRDDAEEQLAHFPKPSPSLTGQSTEQLVHELQVHQIELEAQAEELRRAHLTLEMSRDKFLDLYDFAPLGYLTLSDKALITDVNLTGAALLGVERSGLVNAPFSKFITEKDADQWHRYFVNVLKMGEKQSCTLMLTRKGGSVFPARLEWIRITGSDGTITIRITFTDISDIREVEDALRESGKKYHNLSTMLRLMSDNLPDLIWAKDLEKRYIFANKAICRGLLNAADTYEPIGKQDMFFADRERTRHVDDPEWHTFDEVCRDTDQITMDAGIPQQFDEYGNVQGKFLFLDVHKAPFFDEHGKMIGTVGSARDVTGRKRAEEALRQANKKLTLLSSITRHDINNQLMVLQGYLALFEDMPLDPTHNEYFEKISTAAKRISAMILFTKEYENIGVNAPAWQDTHTLVNTAAKEAQLGKVVVKNDLPAGADIFADPLVVKVFYNLIDNAVRYGGKITTIRFSAEESGDDHLIVCEDDGDGIPVEEKEKIFERGFGKNTGLGLALSREILSITGITITETGEPGKGARFEMVVPKGMWRMAGDGD
jgi:PAS domain S-box-containing protein